MRRLAIRPGAIGDLIVSLPALESLRTEYFEVWVASQNTSLVRFADSVHSISSTGLDMLEFDPPVRLVERLRGFDDIVSWYGAGRVEFREAVARLGLPVRFFPALPEGAGVHATDFYLRQVGSGLSSFGARATRALTPTQAGTPVPHAVIHPFASNQRKRWPLEKFQAVARRLELRVEWCAGPEEELDGAVRISDLHELGMWLSRARVYIGNDSGISHLAAYYGTPTIVLFGPTDPAVWAPRGSRVLYPMDSIEPADVIRTVQDL